MRYEKTSNIEITIVRFRDGDTFEGFIRCGCCHGSAYVTVRLDEIESWEPKGDQRHKAIQVAELATRLYRGRSGVLTRTPTRFDNYGRVLSDVIIDGSALTLQLVAAGLAWWGVREPEPVDASSRLLTTLSHYGKSNTDGNSRGDTRQAER